MADYYEILGVPRSAGVADVRKAYAQIARERHPDRFSDPVEKERAQEFFKDATAAFNALSNEKSRREYDEALAHPQASTPEEIALQAFQQGVQQLQRRAYHEAIELFRSAVSVQPNQARYRAALSAALAHNPHWIRESIVEIEKAISLEPRTAAFQAQLADLLLGQGLKLRARRAAEAALALDPADARATRVWERTAEPEQPAADAGGGLLGRLRKKP